MTSSTDTNLYLSLWDADAHNNVNAMQALDAAKRRGRVLASGAVYAELLGGAGRTVETLDAFFDDTGIDVDWAMDRTIWELAGWAYQGYVRRRTRSHGTPRRILTDFLIGAHAVRHGHALVTMDQRLYRAAFPELQLVRA